MIGWRWSPAEERNRQSRGVGADSRRRKGRYRRCQSESRREGIANDRIRRRRRHLHSSGCVRRRRRQKDGTRRRQCYGRLDCAVNNAGIFRGINSPTHRYTEKTWDAVMRVNLKGVWLCMKYELPQMLKQGGGAIVNMSSIAGLVGLEDMSVYAASKHAVVGFDQIRRAGIRPTGYPS